MGNMSKPRSVTTVAGIVAVLTATPRRTTGMPSPDMVPGPRANAPGAQATVRADSAYADGAYSARGWYGGLPSSITVRVMLANGVITAVRVTPHATDPTSLGLQRRFAAAVPQVVVGKRIDQVNVGRLAGSSGTPQGFNDAIRRIREQARSARRR